MDPITASALAALAGSLGSEAGREAWQGLVALVRRPFRHAAAGSPGVSTGEPEAAALADAPTDPARAQALATALGVRAALDAEFGTELGDWWQRVRSAGGDVIHNSISGTANGPALQGRDFSNMTFNLPPTTRPPSA